MSTITANLNTNNILVWEVPDGCTPYLRRGVQKEGTIPERTPTESGVLYTIQLNEGIDPNTVETFIAFAMTGPTGYEEGMYCNRSTGRSSQMPKHSTPAGPEWVCVDYYR